MKRMRFHFLIIVLMLNVSVAFSQKQLVNISAYKDFNERHFIFISNKYSNLNLLSTPAPQSTFIKNSFDLQRDLKAIPSAIHYKAFFCKMEVKACNRFNFQIKVRAGDDDSFRTTRIIR